MGTHACLIEMSEAIRTINGVSYCFFSDGCIYRTKDGYLVAFRESTPSDEFPEYLDVLDAELIEGE